MGLCFSSGKVLKQWNSKELQVPTLISDMNLKMYELRELKQATRNFSPKNNLSPSVDGFEGCIEEKLVFIQIIDAKNSPWDNILLERVKYVHQLCHPNIMKLIGFCLGDDKLLFVYEFVCGTLQDYLGGSSRQFPPVTWSRCMKVALGIAKGLAFLHHEAQLIYPGFNPCDVLLDSNCNVKLSDIGLIKERQGSSSTEVSESYFYTRDFDNLGYVPAEFVNTGAITEKGNVFGFGVILLEILTEKEVIRTKRRFSDENSEEWARRLFSTHKNSHVLKALSEEDLRKDVLIKVAEIAFKCVSDNPKLRPDMAHVVQVLEQVLEPK